MGRSIIDLEKLVKDYEYSLTPTDYDTYINYEKLYFDAVTDGQLGNFDDFAGNIDDVDIWSKG
jgi:hypothetical protein